MCGAQACKRDCQLPLARLVLTMLVQKPAAYLDHGDDSSKQSVAKYLPLCMAMPDLLQLSVDWRTVVAALLLELTLILAASLLTTNLTANSFKAADGLAAI